MRPESLVEVVDAGRSSIWMPLAEFMDEFYMRHGLLDDQQAMIDDEPALTDDPVVDGFIAAVAEHLALRWGLETPRWTGHPQRLGPDLPYFHIDSPATRGQYLIESPYPFKRRNIFINREPLQRARWPKGESKTPALF